MKLILVSCVFRIGLLGILALMTGCPATGPNPAIVTDQLPAARQNLPYDFTVTLDGGQAPYAWSIAARGAGLSWVAVEPETGRLYNQSLPSKSVTGESVELVVIDANRGSATKVLSLEVLGCDAAAGLGCFAVFNGTCFEGEQQACKGDTTASCAPKAPSESPAACGASCRACGGDANACADGNCVCGNGTACLDGKCCGAGAGGHCTNVWSDAENCGSCGARCDDYAQHANTVGACAQGVCNYAQCQPGFDRCYEQPPAPGAENPSCFTNLKTDIQNCGACGAACPALGDVTHLSVSTCSDGGCRIACQLGYGNCDGNPRNGCELKTDTPQYCGSCQACKAAGPHSFQICNGWQGACGFDCVNEPGRDWRKCGGRIEDGCAIDVKTDVNNCGSCGRVCPSPGPHQVATCKEGTCGLKCEENWANCNLENSDGCETPLYLMSNCGGCFILCLPPPLVCKPCPLLGHCCASP